MRRIAAILAAALLAGCYFDRLTSKFGDMPELGNIEDDAVIAEATTNDADAARIRMRLMELEMEEDPSYRMNAGDQIEIRVYDHPDLGMTTRIGPDGMIGFAFIGQVKLSGQTIAQGAECIREGLVPYVKNPVVSITILEVQSETATIAGSCAKPGVYGISNSTRLADFYAMAGSSANRLFNGVNVDVADLEHSILVRHGEILPVDFRKAIDSGDILNNVRIRKGDYVFIAQRMEASVIVCGEVKNPHKRLYEPGMGLVETLTAAGWVTETHWSHVIIIRGGLANPHYYKVNIDGIMAGKCHNVKLKAGDIVYVPKDNLSEYNVFVRKLLPTAQLVGLIAQPFSTLNKLD
ncbi:MAG: polysaccharide biosynthesis/export family protein [Kiritimatiellae bacterium]|nr:polysaccharide biosynthesis/export family protein [Kiritimatiellia bacterium]